MADNGDAAEFYQTALGAVAARALRARLVEAWPDLVGQEVLGLGHAGPYLRLWRERAYRCVAAAPDAPGVGRWPPFGANQACAVEEAALPFPDLQFDRVLLVHGVETAWNVRGLLREVWRVLKDDGRLLIVAANRRGIWAHKESTPFGQGRPYSQGQIERLLSRSLFRTERRDVALFVPPVGWRPMLRSAPLWERVGRRLAPGLAGVTVTEAVKDTYAAMTLKPAPWRRVLADAAPTRAPALAPARLQPARLQHACTRSGAVDDGVCEPGFHQPGPRAI